MDAIDLASGRPLRRWWMRPRVASLMIVVLMAGMVVGGLAEAVRKARAAARSAQCICNLCAISMALANYHDAWGRFPPAYLADDRGRPMHSWRVLILPYMEQHSLYTAYNFSQPWDGPDNRKLLDKMPNAYACPNWHPEATHLTSYVAITGTGTAFPGARSTDRAAIRDGTGTTVLVGEVANVAIPWTEPRDLDASTMSGRFDDPSRPGLSSFDPGGPALMFADGRYRRLVPPPSPATLRALTTIDGGESIDPKILP